MPMCSVCKECFPHDRSHVCPRGWYVDFIGGNCKICGFNPCRCFHSDGNYEWSAIQDKCRCQTHLADVELVKDNIVEAAFGSSIFEVNYDLYCRALAAAGEAIRFTASFQGAIEYVKREA